MLQKHSFDRELAIKPTATNRFFSHCEPTNLFTKKDKQHRLNKVQLQQKITFLWKSKENI